MKNDKTEHYAKVVSTILLALFMGFTFFMVPVAEASPAADNAAAGATFKGKCAMCHGPDGAGSTVGKSMNVPDLRSAEVQKLPDAQLVQIISEGKGGMPPFKNALSEDQIHSLVTYVRSLNAKK